MKTYTHSTPPYPCPGDIGRCTLGMTSECGWLLLFLFISFVFQLHMCIIIQMPYNSVQYDIQEYNTTTDWLSTQIYHWLAFNTDLPLIGFQHRPTTDWLSTQTYHWLAFNTDLPLTGVQHRPTTDWLSTQTYHWLAFNTDLPLIGFQHRLIRCWNSRTLWQCYYKYAMWWERKHMNLLFLFHFCVYISLYEMQ